MELTHKDKEQMCLLCSDTWRCPLTGAVIKSAEHLSDPPCDRITGILQVQAANFDGRNKVGTGNPAIRILIWASGSALRFGGTTKQLLPINGEKILLRTLRLLPMLTPHAANTVVVTNKKDIKQELDALGAQYYTPENCRWLTDTILSTEPLWGVQRTICLYADVYYAPKTLKAILDHDGNDLMFFSRKGEILGFSFTPEKHDFIKQKCAFVSQEANAGRAKTKGKGWCLYRTCAGHSLNDRNFESDIMVKFHDRTTDVDSLASYEKKIANGFFTHSSFLDPGRNKYADGVTVITPTGDRPDAFALCYAYMERQTRRPDQWIVVDDGTRPLDVSRYPMIDTYIRRSPEGRQPKHTLARNLREAVNAIRFDKCVMVEDDDWYHPDYIRLLADVLQREDLVGQRQVIEFNLQHKKYRVKRTRAHSSLCCTAFTWAAYENLRVIVHANDSMLVDRQLWNSFNGCKKLLKNTRPYLVVGLKGVEGRPGRSRGHKLRFLKRSDPDGRHLRKLIGQDFEVYRQYYS